MTEVNTSTNKMINIIKKYDPDAQEKLCIKLHRVELHYSNLMMTIKLN